jgi:hypothetical protein
MPGAPNRPPEGAGAPASAAPPAPAGAPERPILRRLVPSHVALLLDSWKGAAPAEVLAPFERAEASLAAGDLPGATQALDLLSIRFAEPRWPTLPEPFRQLRVPIPAPMPPGWDPENAMPATEREGRRARRAAETQLALAAASVAWADAHGLEAADLAAAVDRARGALGSDGVPPAFYAEIDGLWSGLRSRLPRPKSVGRSAPATASAEPDVG